MEKFWINCTFHLYLEWCILAAIMNIFEINSYNLQLITIVSSSDEERTSYKNRCIEKIQADTRSYAKIIMGDDSTPLDSDLERTLRTMVVRVAIALNGRANRNEVATFSHIATRGNSVLVTGTRGEKKRLFVLEGVTPSFMQNWAKVGMKVGELMKFMPKEISCLPDDKLDNYRFESFVCIPRGSAELIHRMGKELLQPVNLAPIARSWFQINQKQVIVAIVSYVAMYAFLYYTVHQDRIK